MQRSTACDLHALVIPAIFLLSRTRVLIINAIESDVQNLRLQCRRGNGVVVTDTHLIATFTKLRLRSFTLLVRSKSHRARAKAGCGYAHICIVA